MAQSHGAAKVHRQQPLVEIGSDGSVDSPHFMSPTIASKLSQVNGREERATTPTSIKSIKSDRGQSLLQSAVQRVGRRRAATNDTNRGVNASPARPTKDNLDADKLSTPTKPNASDASPKTPSGNVQRPQRSPLDKPLPALPTIRVEMAESLSSTNSTETADEPHQRIAFKTSSPEEQKIFEPSQVPPTESLQQKMARTGLDLMQQAPLKERYPNSGVGTQQRQISDHRPIISRYSSMSKKSHEEILSVVAKEPSDTTSVLHVSGIISDPFEIVANATGAHMTTESDETLSAGAAALEKSASDTRTDQSPRQTRTSSLRARLSAGQLVKDSQNKVVGFTDFTVSDASNNSLTDITRHDSFTIRREPSINRFNNNLNLSLQKTRETPSLQQKTSSYSLHSNLSAESLLKDHAPAQFVGGSRRTISNPRSLSRNSNRTASHDATSIPAYHHVEVSATLLPGRSLESGSERPITETQGKPRKSSIPVPTHSALNAMFKPNSSPAIVRKSTRTNITPPKTPHIEATVRRDRSSGELLSDLEVEVKHSFKTRGSPEILKDALEYRSLASIEESPRPVFTLKRLSTKSPEYGPKLRISPSAERFIMGENNDKENQSVYGKSSKNLFQRASGGLNKQKRGGVSPAPAFKQRPDRPVSSHGILQSSPRVPNFDSKVRERKVRSADMSSTLSLNATATLDPSRQNTDASKGSKASSNDMSFVSAQEESFNGAQNDAISASPETDARAAVDEAAWINGSKENIDDSSVGLPSTNSSFDSSVAFLHKQAQPGKAMAESPSNRHKVIVDNEVTSNSSASNVTVKHMPFTPLDTIGKISSHPSRRRHPPRSSSNVPQHNFTSSPSPTEPSVSKEAPSTPPKEEKRQENIQNSHGARHGHTSWQVDIDDFKSVGPSSLQDKSIGDKRESIVTPMTNKKSFSSFRNLFNKRTPATEPSKTKSSKHYPSNSSTKIKQANKKNKKNSTISVSSSIAPLPSKQTHPDRRSTNVSSSPAIPSPPKSAVTISTTSPASTTMTPTPTTATTAATSTSPSSPSPVAMVASTNLAMRLISAAQGEQDSAKKEKLFQMSKIMVDALTQAREAEKAAEEAKMASRRAEMAKEICGKMVEEVGRVVGEWSDTVL